MADPGAAAAEILTPQNVLYTAYGIVAIGLVLFLVFGLRSIRKPRRLKLERLWVIPALYTLFAIGLFWRQPPHGVQWLWALGAALLGGGFGWLRGRTMRISVDPVTHSLNQRQSPAALLLIATLVAGRYYVRSQVGIDLTHAGAGVIDAFVAFAVGILSMQRLEMYLRARRLLDDAKAARLTQGFA